MCHNQHEFDKGKLTAIANLEKLSFRVSTSSERKNNLINFKNRQINMSGSLVYPLKKKRTFKKKENHSGFSLKAQVRHRD